MQLPAAIFREYDIRGIVGDQLTPEVARAIGQAIATLGWERLGRAPRLAVGRAQPPSRPGLARGLSCGTGSAGSPAGSACVLSMPGASFADLARLSESLGPA